MKILSWVLGLAAIAFLVSAVIVVPSRADDVDLLWILGFPWCLVLIAWGTVVRLTRLARKEEPDK